jgi:hypothetical protein
MYINPINLSLSPTHQNPIIAQDADTRQRIAAYSVRDHAAKGGRMKLSYGTLFFEDATTPESAKNLAELLRETVLPVALFYMIRVEGDEKGTTIEFRRRTDRG